MTASSGRRTLTLSTVIVAALIVFALMFPTWRAAHQADLNNCLIRAVDANNARDVTALLRDGADPNTLVTDDARPLWRRLLDALMRRPLPSTHITVMWRAAYWFHRLPEGSTSDNWETIKQLADAGADVNVHLPDGSSPLLAAAAFCKVKSLKQLLDHGANVRVCDELGYTALHFAASALREDMAAILLQHGASLQAKNRMGVTPLLAALESYPGESGVDKARSRHMARFLLSHGATLDGTTQDGMTLPQLARFCRDRFKDDRITQLIEQAQPAR